VSDADLLIEQRGELALLTLNRPRALNALSLAMVKTIHQRLGAWWTDPKVGAVVIRGAGERAFCAGGDIRWIYDLIRREGGRAAIPFYAAEYPMNARIHHFPKPYLAFLDGVTMGGGVGVGIHGSHRIATERTLFAMPETGIGLFPDVGATFLLSRLPGAIGTWLGLTGARLNAADCIHLGIATHFVRADRLDDLLEALAKATYGGGAGQAVDEILGRFTSDPGPSPLATESSQIDRLFGADSLGEVVARLAADPSDWAAEQRAILSTRSPTSLAVTFRQLREGRARSFDDAMRIEYRLVSRFMTGHDFVEGVRAVIIDKDQAPRWRPATIGELDPAEIDRYFAPLEAGELSLAPEPAGGETA
jgi:enoyl-CoA hydratase